MMLFQQQLKLLGSFGCRMENMADAMQKAQSVEPAKVGAQMYQASHQGVAGTYAYDDKGNLKQATITVLTFSNSVPVPLASY